MVRKSGSADLPLHGGRVPPWLADRMTRLGAVISQAIVHFQGRTPGRQNICVLGLIAAASGSI